MTRVAVAGRAGRADFVPGDADAGPGQVGLDPGLIVRGVRAAELPAMATPAMNSLVVTDFIWVCCR